MSPSTGKFSNATRLSKRFVPRSTRLHPWMRGSGTYSYWRASTWASCTRASHCATGASPSTATRTGRVLMSMPTMESTPGRSAGRPETVAPNTTSRSPEYRDSSSAQEPCTTALTVSRCVRANAYRRREASADSRVTSRSVDCARWLAAGRRSYGSAVGSSNPSSRVRQYASASVRSCRSSHSTYARNGRRAGSTGSSPAASARYAVVSSSSIWKVLQPSSSTWWEVRTTRTDVSDVRTMAIRAIGAADRSMPRSRSSARWRSSARACSSLLRPRQSRWTTGVSTCRRTTSSGRSTPSHTTAPRRTSRWSVTCCQARSSRPGSATPVRTKLICSK